jgi:hypothetical protein
MTSVASIYSQDTQDCVQTTDPEIAKVLEQELERQQNQLEMICRATREPSVAKWSPLLDGFGPVHSFQEASMLVFISETPSLTSNFLPVNLS